MKTFLKLKTYIALHPLYYLWTLLCKLERTRPDCQLSSAHYGFETPAADTVRATSTNLCARNLLSVQFYESARYCSHDYIHASCIYTCVCVCASTCTCIQAHNARKNISYPRGLTKTTMLYVKHLVPVSRRFERRVAGNIQYSPFIPFPLKSLQVRPTFRVACLLDELISLATCLLDGLIALATAPFMCRGEAPECLRQRCDARDERYKESHFPTGDGHEESRKGLY